MGKDEKNTILMGQDGRYVHHGPNPYFVDILNEIIQSIQKAPVPLKHSGI